MAESAACRRGPCFDAAVSRIVSLKQVLDQTDEALLAGESAAPQVWPTGFPVLDSYLGGGMRAGELILLGGPQGLGKTALALQVLRNALAAGMRGIYFSFEHDEQTLLERLIAIESGTLQGEDGLRLRLVREAMQKADASRGTLFERLSAGGIGTTALDSLAAWSDRLLLHRSNSSMTTAAEIRAVVEDAIGDDEPPLIVVDYLQKVAVQDRERMEEEERVTTIVEALKDLALEVKAPVLAIVAADREGITTGRRLRVHNLRGSSALAYEADVVLLMNDKYDVVARHHLVYDVGNAERFRAWVVVSIEKNRGGLDRIDLEFRKRLEQSRFESEGQLVGEQLVDERVFVE